MKKVRDPRTGAWVCSRSIWAWPLLALALVLCASPALAQTRIAPPGVSSSAPIDAQYWVGAADATLTQEKNLGALGTGLVINTAGTPSIYAGVLCTNQFLRGLSALGAGNPCATVGTADLALLAVGSAQMAVVNTLKTQCVVVGANNGTALIDGDLGPQSRQFLFNAPMTITEVTVAADGGTPNVILGRSRAGVIANFTSAALATAASGGIACSKTGAVTCLDGATTASATLQNTGVNAGDWLTLVSGTAGGTAKEMTACITGTVS